jgi:thiol-disulfide isomerase/thioredoxin
MQRWRSRASATLGLVLALSLLTACSNDSLADQYTAGDNKGYIAGDGSVLEIQEDERGEPIVFSGTGENGEPITSAGYTGDVLVVNFWYAACAPCRLEAPDLEDTYQKVKDQGVEFLGVNVRDQAETAKEFSATFGVSYPSIIDTNGDTQLSFAGEVAPNAVPTTLILDRKGRVAARILGRVTEVSILESLIDSMLQEQA